MSATDPTARSFARKSLPVTMEQRTEGEQVAAVPNRIVTEQGAPQSTRVDNGSEFVSKVLD